MPAAMAVASSTVKRNPPGRSDRIASPMASPPTTTAATNNASDSIAIGALRAFREHGIHVPDTMAVTGFDDIPFADMISPSLTTVQQPVAAMARNAFEWVSGESSPPMPPGESIVLLKGDLIVRESA